MQINAFKSTGSYSKLSVDNCLIEHQDFRFIVSNVARRITEIIAIIIIPAGLIYLVLVRLGAPTFYPPRPVVLVQKEGLVGYSSRRAKKTKARVFVMLSKRLNGTFLL